MMKGWRLACGAAFVITQVLLACASADNGTSPTVAERGLATHAVADADVALDADVADAIAIEDAAPDGAIPDSAMPDAPPPLDGGPTPDADVATDAGADGASSPPTTSPTPGSSSGTSGAVTAPEFDGSFGSPGKPNDEECAMAPGHKPTRPGYLAIAAMLGLALAARRRRR